MVTPATRQKLSPDPPMMVGAVDVRWWSHTTQRVTYMVFAIESAEDGKFTISFTSANDRDRVLTVPADRRFLKATQG